MKGNVSAVATIQEISDPKGPAECTARPETPSTPGPITKLAAMAKAAGLPAVAPFYINADATPNPGGWPRGGAGLPALPNHHLQYAITWFALAVAAIVIYVLAQRG